MASNEKFLAFPHIPDHNITGISGIDNLAPTGKTVKAAVYAVNVQE